MTKKTGFAPAFLNCTGPEIEEYQKALRAAGSKIKVCGTFTIGMLSAVKAFQKKNGLEVTGIIDKKTHTKLMKILTSKK